MAEPRSKRVRRVVWGITALAVVAAALYAAQPRVVFLASRFAFIPALWGMEEMRVVEMTTADGVHLQAWYAPPASGEDTVIYFPGARGHLGLSGFRVRPFLERGEGVLMVGYRGYGSNEGRPSERGLYRDAEAAVAFVRRRGVETSDMLFYGYSLGTAVAIHTAADAGALAGLVLEAPLKSMADLARHHWVFLPRRLMRYRFDSYAKMARIEAPTLILHGTEDQVVPISHARALYERAQTPKRLEAIRGANHNDVFDRGGREHVLRFRERVRAASRPGR